MSDHDYEALFNDILVKTRERRKGLKESLDRYFDEDTQRTSEILAEILRVNDRAHTIEGNRAAFMSLMTAMRAVKATRDEVLERVDKLMEEVRQFLSIKEEMANERLDKLTQLFREELGNPSFKFQFHLLDDQELHHLSELRSLGRKTGELEEPPTLEPAPPASRAAPSRDHRAILEEPSPAFLASEQETPLADAAKRRYFTPDPVQEPAATETKGGGWDEEPVDIKPEILTTLHGVAPDPVLATDGEESLEVQPEPESSEQEATGPYEVDVDVLKILSEETFRPTRKGR